MCILQNIKQNKMIKEEKKVSKVYGYCRLALADNKEMVKQMKLVEDYCKNNNFRLDSYFCDNGGSGFKTGEEFANLLKELKRGDIVIVRDISRLSRDIYKCMDLMSMFENMGVTLKIIN